MSSTLAPEYSPSVSRADRHTEQRSGRVWKAGFALLAALTLAGQAEALFGLSSVPAQISALGLDKPIHVAIFAAPIALLVLAGVPRRIVIPLALVYAVASEYIQGTYLTGRTFDPKDIVADLVGIALALVLTAGVRRRTSRSH